MPTLDSAVLSAWYCSRPEIRRLLAIRDAEGLRVLVELEPAQDSSETHPTWLANRRVWSNELEFHMCSVVRLERTDAAVPEDALSPGDIVADLSWRDPSIAN